MEQSNYSEDVINESYQKFLVANSLEKLALSNKNSYEFEDDVTDTDNTTIEFVKFDKAREIVQIAIQQLLSNIIKIDIECPICFEVCDKLTDLHNDVRHGVCDSCSLNLTSCPFCRLNLAIKNNNHEVYT